MDHNTEVLIIGAGPTGLMLACQLVRFDIRLRIIDKKIDRAHESRAFAVQAKSMEIFQNLGVVNEFLKLAQRGREVAFYADGKEKITLELDDWCSQDTPFPAIYFLSQAETERILIEYLEKKGILVEREMELQTFTQDENRVVAEIKNNRTQQIEKTYCQYIVGCDGAHSVVRHTLNLTFEGAAYEQAFILADAKIQWPFSSKNFMFFTAKTGILIHIPLDNETSRLIIARGAISRPTNAVTLTSKEVEQLASEMTAANVKLTHSIWMSRFHLHHRGVNHYQKGRAFVAGDAAHIHSPVGGQGMNTGLQDATNLAWKLAFVIRDVAPEDLLSTYDTERHRIGEILLKTTDRIFVFVSSNNYFLASIRRFLLPLLFKFVLSKRKMRQRLFRFVSQLAIRYHDNKFVYEIEKNPDVAFNLAPKAGCRAPNAPANDSTLFELLENNKCNILIFNHEVINEIKVKRLENKYSGLIRIHHIKNTVDNSLLYQRYGVTSAAVYFIRPDGYIGFRSYGSSLQPLEEYFNVIFSGISA